jgi:radical SAM-linked protein
MRYRLTFAKKEAMRFTGNLDLHRTLERAMRRAGLPLTYSQGFTPRPKITLASALPLGYTSDYELADFWLDKRLPVEDIRRALEESAPPGLGLIDLVEVDLEEEKLQNAITGATFIVTLLDPDPELEDKIAGLMKEMEIIKEKFRKGKKRVYDLRKLIQEVKILPQDSDGHRRLEMCLRAGEGMTGRPDDVLVELGIDPYNTRIHRTMIELSPKENER